MKDCIIVLSSMTISKRAQKGLQSFGIVSEIVSVDSKLTKNGCSFGLTVDCYKVDSAVEILDRKRIKHGEVLGTFGG